MTPPIRPQQFDRQAALRDGWKPEEIDEFLAQQERAPAKSTDPTATGRWRPDNLLRQASQGMTLGLADEMAGGLNVIGKKLTGDTRPAGELYREERDRVRGLSNAYREANPGTALAANVVGGLVTGKAIPKIPTGSGVTAGSRIASGAVNGAAQGAVSGAASGEGSLMDRVKSGGAGMVAGGIAGGTFTGIAEALRGGKNLVQGGRDFLRARQGQPVPMTDADAARETLPLLARSGKSVEQLRAASDAAEDPDLLAEVMGPRGVRTLGTAHRYGLKPEPISQTLDARAMDEAPNFANKLQALTGGRVRDPRAVADEAFEKVQPEVARLLGVANPRTASAEKVGALLDEVDQLRADGVDIWKPARASDASFPDSMEPFRPKSAAEAPLSPILDEFGRAVRGDVPPPREMTVQELRTLRQSLDKLIDYSGSPAASGLERNAQGRLKALRAQVRDLVHEFGGEEAQTADDLVRKASARGEAFEAGQMLRSGRDPRSTTAEGIAAARQASRDPSAFREGAASDLINTTRAARDGTTGGVSNPTTAGFASPKVKARTREAFKDDATFQQAERAAENVSNRLRTRGQVLHGSQTAERLADDIQEIAPGFLESLASGNIGGAARSGLKVANQGARGSSLDRKARILLAGGGEGNLTRNEALDLLEAARRFAKAQGATQSSRASTVGRTAGAAAGETSSRR